MSPEPQKSTRPPTGGGFALRLKVFYAALFITLGVQLPFLPVWFAAKGLDAQAIGIALAVPMLVRVFAIPMATRMADRRDALRAVIIIVTVVGVAGYAILGFAAGFAAIVLAYALASAAYAPAMTLADVYALRGLARWRLAYGPVRLWGSAAFIAASFGAGSLLDVMAPHDLIWLIVGAMTLAALAACALAPLQGGGASSGIGDIGSSEKMRPNEESSLAAVTVSAPSGRSLWRDPVFLAVVAATSLIQASHALYYGFSTIDWRAAGFDGTTIGALWALGVLAEIVLFAASARLPAAVTPTRLLLIGAAGAVLRWAAMALAPPLAVLPALQCLHGLSFGATHLGALSFVARAAPVGLGATAQGYLAVVLGLAMAAAMGMSGVLYERYGAAAYGAMALVACGGGLCALAAHRLRG